jgi:DNA-binding MarR family transcriptional regulator
MQDASSEKIHQAIDSVQHALGRIAALASILPSSLAGTTLAAMAERLYLERRRRADYFPAGLFGEPAWDLMLALFVAREEGRRLSVAEAYEAAAVKPAAGRRLLAKMERVGLVARSGGEEDRRKRYVELSQNAHERLSDYLTRHL